LKKNTTQGRRLGKRVGDLPINLKWRGPDQGETLRKGELGGRKPGTGRVNGPGLRQKESRRRI